MDRLFDLVISFLPLLATAAGVAVFLFVANWGLLARHPEFSADRRLPRQLTMLVLLLAGVVAIVLALPVGESMRNQVIALIGVLVSGVVAFSSTTIISNLMAGLMLHAAKSFRTGDFIRVGDYFGRVAGRGLFNTEIQTERRELVYLANTYMISHPIVVVRTSGTIVSASLSLGYDVHHTRIKSLLIAAAREVGLQEPFVKIVELGNYAITYRVSGLLVEVKGMLSARSNFYETILDTLNGEGIEIASPTIMNQRRLADDARIMPAASDEIPEVESTGHESLVFDKAEQAEQLEKAKNELHEQLRKMEKKLAAAEGDEKQAIAELIAQKRSLLAEFERDRKDAGEDEPAGGDENAPKDSGIGRGRS
ncbi:MAG: mechanosensitive ion channel [Gammaproteobacteria bacterium]|nr:mechanosensitive ion channel [Gammaproteobacteria bacterium]MBU1647580.1 mechanosensitive ion channel [Gammaproteobacteria bacterium]MBU1971469.1 mechanosensitive ion channel [Gammaproteobacteria bacterium]